MFPNWLRSSILGHGVIIDLTKKYFGDNEKMSVLDWYNRDTFSELININTTGIGYIFRTSISPDCLITSLESLLGRIFDIEIEAVTESNYKLLNDYRDFGENIFIIKAYFELRKFSLWDVDSKIPLLFFILCLLNSYDYENCPYPGTVYEAGRNYNLSLLNILTIATEVSKYNATVTRPDRSFCRGIIKFFRYDATGLVPYRSIRTDLEGITYLLAHREDLQDAVRNLPLDTEVITKSLITHYDKLRRKF